MTKTLLNLHFRPRPAQKPLQTNLYTQLILNSLIIFLQILSVLQTKKTCSDLPPGQSTPVNQGHSTFQTDQSPQTLGEALAKGLIEDPA